MRSQALRIDELKSEIASLKDELARLHARDEQITDVLAVAHRKASEYEKEARIRFSLECERLECYRQKWQGYISNLSSAEKLGAEIIKTETALKNIAIELQQFVDDELPFYEAQEEDYVSEKERILSLDDKKTNNSISSMTNTELQLLIHRLIDKENDKSK
ncbi:MAG: hypothetical protein LBU04_03015 [Christensenellaceae bacterium]|nr:hypothetical protein [Christensenellaceae bacterium]